jgi:predicted metal-binding membrane protein
VFNTSRQAFAAVARRPGVTGSTGRLTWTVVATLGVASVCWVVSVRLMTGMNMGVMTQLGSFWSFAAVWLAMMTAMMLPGAVPAAARASRAHGLLALPEFALAYLTVWALAGIVVFAADRPHGTTAAAVATIAAGLYELTPLKLQFRRRCREMAGRGFGFGLCCLGSCAGLMAMLVVLGVMSVGWMVVIAVLVTAQKLLPPRAGIDVPLALAIIALGVLIGVYPWLIPWVTQAI